MGDLNQTEFKTRLRKGDQVVVITGKDKGKRGAILQVLGDKNAVLVEKVNMMKRHTKPSRSGGGGIIDKEAPIQLSNVMLIDPSTGKGTRIGAKFLQDGRKVRVAKKSGEVLDK